jgi:response regulator RpfG family c-di-GMP phosphodiesterase
MSIKLRLLIALIPVMVIFLVLLIYFGTLSENSVKYEHRQYVRAIATSYAARFSTIADSASTIAETLVNSVEAEPHLTEEFVRGLLQKNIMEKNTGIFGLGILLEPHILGAEYAPYYRRNSVNKDGVTDRSLASGGYDYRNREWYRTPSLSGKGHWTEPYLDRGGGDALVVTYSTPIISKNRFIGVIRVDITIDDLVKELKDFKITDKSQAFLVTDKGRCIGSSDGSLESGGTFWNNESFLRAPGTKALLQKLGEGKSTSARLQNPLTNEESRFYIRPITPLKLNVVFVSTIKEIRAPVLHLNRILSGICIAFFILAVVLILWTSTSVARPIERLVKQAEKYSSGNFEERLDETEGASEIKKLSKAFNAMGEEIARKLRELKEAQKEIVLHLVKAAEHRDADTGLHIMRMSQYCAVLARAYGMSQDEWDLLLHASPMHDIGKIGISDIILQKPGKLDEKEYSVMKTHTIIGESILSDGKSQLLRMAQIVAHFHHEKWDGSGYPNGLKGEEIPLQARIACIADVFDALTMKRPYKRAWTVDEALQELERQSGKDFDPSLVALFMEHLEEILEIKDTFRDESLSSQGAPGTS